MFHTFMDTKEFVSFGQQQFGTNKQIFYKIYHSVDEIEESAVVKLIREAVALDELFKYSKPKSRKLNQQ